MCWWIAFCEASRIFYGRGKDRSGYAANPDFKE